MEDLTTLHLRRAREGSAESLSEVVSRLSPILLAQASWRLGALLKRDQDPEDLVAEAWATTLPKLKDLPLREGRATPVLLKFLSTCIVNRVNNLSRKVMRRQGTAQAGDAGDALSRVDDLPAEWTGIVTAAIRNERRGTLQDALDGLDLKDREVVFLRGVEQCSFETVGLLLGVTPEAATMRYQRALARLRGLLRASVFDELD